MKEIIVTPVTTTPIVETPVKVGATDNETIEYLVYYFFGFVEVLLAIRLILKIAGASVSSGFVRLIYALAGFFTMPFDGIFRRSYAEGAGSSSILEPAVLIAIGFYLLLAWGIVKLIRISSGEKQPE